MDRATWVRQLWQEITGDELDVCLLTDCDSLQEQCCSLSNVQKDRLLTKDVFAIREALRHGITHSVSHMPGKKNPADALTRRPAKAGRERLRKLAEGKAEDVWKQVLTDKRMEPSEVPEEHPFMPVAWTDRMFR